MVLRLVAAVSLMAVGCAHVESPPGGPEDRDPPGVLTTRPEDGAVVPGYDGPVVFVFDERISERGVPESVIVSPRTSPVVIDDRRDEVRVSLRRGWEAGHIYHVSVGREVRDLFGNQLAAPAVVVFSTGPEIPETRASGAAVDLLTGRTDTGVRIEAIRVADSLVYAVPPDSAGGFLFERIPPGEYQIRAFQDINRNRSLEIFEPRDSVFTTVATAEGAPIRLRMLLPDSTPAVAGDATITQGRVRVDFDDYLDPTQELDSTNVVVADPTGATVPVVTVTTGAQGVSPRPGADTTSSVVPPTRQLTIELAAGATLAPETEYTIRIQGLRNVNGLVGDVEATVTTPPAPPRPTALVSGVPPGRYIASPRAGLPTRTSNFVVNNGRT